MNPVRFHSQNISAMKKALFAPNNKYAEFRTTTPKGSVVQYVNLGGGKAKKQILKHNGTIIISELSATDNPHKIGKALNVRELYPESYITTTFKEDFYKKIRLVARIRDIAVDCRNSCRSRRTKVNEPFCIAHSPLEISILCGKANLAVA